MDLTRATSARRSLFGNLVLYVRADGSDSNSGFANTAAGAFLTIQKAVDTVLNKLDLNGFDVTINVASGTYTGAVVIARPFVGKGTVTIQGNYVTPSNVVISTTSASCFTVTNGASVQIGGMKLQTTTSGDCINSTTGAYVASIQNEFGACAGQHINAGTGIVLLSGDYTISGGAVSHWHVGGNSGLITMGTLTITLTGTPAFSAYFAGVSQGCIVCTGVTFSGSATGKRFLTHHNGVIKCTGQALSYFPGSTDGEASDGGIYLGTQNAPAGIDGEVGYASGDYIPPLGVVTPADTLLSSTPRIIFMPVRVPHRLSINAIGLWPTVNGVGSGHVARLGLYKSDGRGRPKTTGGLIVDAGTIDLTSGSVNVIRSAAFSAVELPEGLYWVAVSWNAAVTTMVTARTVLTRGAISSNNPIGSTPMSCLFNNSDQTAGLPTTIPSLSPNNAANVCPGALLVVA